MNKISLIGNGYWGSKIAKYIPNHFNLVSVANSKTDLQEIWNSEADSVIIATPIETHYDLTKKALHAGKNVYVEKPIALKYEEGKELIKIAREKGLKLDVEYTQMFSKGLQYIQSKDIGEIEFIEMSTKHLGRFMDYDVFWLLASHHLSVLPMFFSLEELDFEFKKYMFHNGICTTGSIECRVKGTDKVKSRLDVSLNYHQKEFCINIYGQKGFARYDPMNPIPVSVTWYEKKHSALPNEMITNVDNIGFDEMNNLNHSVEHFKRLVEGLDEDNLEIALEVTRVIEHGSKL